MMPALLWLPLALLSHSCPASKVEADRYALLVGIDTYPNPDNNTPPLDANIAELKRVLRTRFGFAEDHIRVLRNKQATRTAIIDSFRNFLGNAGPTGTAVFYFVGHGLELDKDYSVAEHEPRGKDQSLFVWGEPGRGGIILDDELLVLLQELRAEHRVAIIDACYSGPPSGLIRGLRKMFASALSAFSDEAPRKQESTALSARFVSDGDPADIPKTFISDGRVLPFLDSLPLAYFAAAADSQLASVTTNYPSFPKVHAVFSYHLASALEAAPANQTLDALLTSVAQQMGQRRMCQIKPTDCQTPSVRGLLKKSTIVDAFGRP